MSARSRAVPNARRAQPSSRLPSAKVTSYYLDSDGKANTRHGRGTIRTAGPGRGPPDEFVYDPANPVRSVSSRTAGARGGLPQGSVDNRVLEDGPNIRVYTSEPLAEVMEVTGAVAAKIYFSTDVPDTDITVKLLDVSPDGKALNISEEIARARYRRSHSATEMLESGRIYAIDVELFPTSNFFEVGHRIRVEVSSSDFPNFGRNLDTGRNNETSTEMRVAHTRVHHSTGSRSSITLPVVPIATPKWAPPLP